MSDKNTHAILAFAGTAFLLSAMNNRSLLPKAQTTLTVPPQPTDVTVQSQTSEDANYLVGFAVGAAAMGAAWYAFSRARPHLHSWTTAPSY